MQEKKALKFVFLNLRSYRWFSCPDTFRRDQKVSDFL